MWVQLVEKAWAKVCGSYEAAKSGTTAKVLNNIDGTPNQVFLTSCIEKRNQQTKLCEILEKADCERYVVAVSID